jgi:Icc-related predicted phosphoesterase
MPLELCCIADTHSLHELVPIIDCDYLFMAGDITGNGSLWHLNRVSNWMATLKKDKVVRKNIIVIAGNHDKELAKDTMAKSYLSDVIYLENQEYIIPENGMKVYGTPYTPEFMNWYFMQPRDQMMEKVWSHVPDDTNILLSHGPQYGVLDELGPRFRRTSEDPHVGCKAMAERTAQLKSLKYVFTGHIHSGYGKQVVNGVTFLNCSVCNEYYEPVNKPFYLDI